MSIPYCWGSQVISLQMGSAVLSCRCQKQWTSNMAARGHIASCLYKASSPLLSRGAEVCVSGDGGSFGYPAGDSVAHALQPILSICLCQLWYVLPILKFNSVYREAIWLLPREDGSLFKLGMSVYPAQRWVNRLTMGLNSGSPLTRHQG